MAQLVTTRGWWRLRRLLMGLLAVMVGLILVQAATLSAHRVVPVQRKVDSVDGRGS